MNNGKTFIRRAQKLIYKSFQTKANLDCSIKKLDYGCLAFCIIHFDKRYTPFGNRSIYVYEFNADNGFSNAESFINKLLAGEDILIDKEY